MKALRNPAMPQRMAIRGVGELLVSYDRLRLVSTATPDELDRALRGAGFEKWVHDLNVDEPERLSRHYRSKLEFTPVGGPSALKWLEANEALLKSYNFTKVEVACDVPASEPAILKGHIAQLIKTVAKPRATRGYFVATRHGARRQLEAPDPDQPTLYVENRRSSVALKFYSRFAKGPSGSRTNDMLARLELTFTRSQVIKSKFGGSRMTDLLNADLPTLVRKQLRLEQVDYAQVGKLVGSAAGKEKSQGTAGSCLPIPHGYANKDDYLATRRAVAMLMYYAAKNERRLVDWDYAKMVTLHSPIAIRGILKELQRNNPAITDYEISRCFRRMTWRRRVRLPRRRRVRL